MNTKVSNPLSIVAIFAALAEAFATIALINVPHDIQQIFVIFVMAFPTLIVVLFFSVLNWNHTVLYAPGDFADESMYLESIKLLRSEVISNLAIPSPDVPPLTPQQFENVSFKVDTAFRNAILEQREHVTAVVEHISKSLSDQYARDQKIITYLKENGISTEDDLGRATKLSSSTIRNYVIRLEKNGMIKKIDRNSYEATHSNDDSKK